LALASPAFCQERPVVSFESTSDSQRVSQYVDDAAQCLAKNEIDAPIVREYLVARFDPRDRELYGKKLSSRIGCNNQYGPTIAIEFGGDMFRYGLANALVRKDYLDNPITDFSKAPPLRHFQPASLSPDDVSGKSRKSKQAAKDHANAMQIFMYSLIGECLARRATVQVVELLRLPVSSKREGQALTGLAPTIIACGKMQKSMTFSQSWTRGAIALAYYRLAFSLDPRPLPNERKL
jgi:hypothetical protein